MIFPPIPIDETGRPLAEVVQLAEVRARLELHEDRGARVGLCQHNRLLIDSQLAQVKCKDCGEQLNPMAVLERFAKQESRWEWRRQELDATLKKLEQKQRCKCQHCGRMTRVNP